MRVYITLKRNSYILRNGYFKLFSPVVNYFRILLQFYVTLFIAVTKLRFTWIKKKITSTKDMGMHTNSFNNRIMGECVHRLAEIGKWCKDLCNYLVVRVCTHGSGDSWIDPWIT